MSQICDCEYLKRGNRNRIIFSATMPQDHAFYYNGDIINSRVFKKSFQHWEHVWLVYIGKIQYLNERDAQTVVINFNPENFDFFYNGIFLLVLFVLI